MQVQKIQNKYSNFNKSVNFNKKHNVSNPAQINFQGSRPGFVPINADSFKYESARIMYSKLQKYLKLIGKSGSIENLKLMKDRWKDYIVYDISKYTNPEATTFLSINKNADRTYINISRESIDKSKNITILEAICDEKGQMIQGNFFPEKLRFERYGTNIRRMTRRGKQHFPVGKNDREWDFLVHKITSSKEKNQVYCHPLLKEDNSLGGAFEIFIELARLRTSIM